MLLVIAIMLLIQKMREYEMIHEMEMILETETIHEIKIKLATEMRCEMRLMPVMAICLRRTIFRN